MLDNFKFETFVDAHSNIFEEYLSSVISKLRETNSEYRSIEEKIESLYRQYPKVLDGFLPTPVDPQCDVYMIRHLSCPPSQPQASAHCSAAWVRRA